MLNGIHLVDFGNHRDTRLTFGPMTALVGQNGSGKTTVMRAILEVLRLAAYPGGQPDDSHAFRRRGAIQEKLAASWPAKKNAPHSYEADHGLVCAQRTHHLYRRRKGVEEEVWLPDPNWKQPPRRVEKISERVQKTINPTDPEEGAVVEIDDLFRTRCRYFKTSTRALQNAAVADQEKPTIADDGSNLAWVLSYLMTADPERFALIVEALKEVVPIVRRIRSRPVKLTRFVKQTITVNSQDRTFDEKREVMGQELIFDMKSGDSLPATLVSEGTLVVLAVLTLVYGSDADLIMLDDVELGLHPKAQRDLVRQLRRIQETHPNLQIIVSTHSPYVVDEFKAEDVWVFAPDKEGCAVTKRLSEHPDAKRALEVLTTGEFWSAEGEPWVLDEELTARVAEEPGV